MKQQTIENLKKLITVTESKADIDTVVANASQYNEDNLTEALNILVEQPSDHNWFIKLVLDMIAGDKFDNLDLDSLVEFCAELEDARNYMVDALYNAANLDLDEYLPQYQDFIDDLIEYLAYFNA